MSLYSIHLFVSCILIIKPIIQTRMLFKHYSQILFVFFALCLHNLHAQTPGFSNKAAYVDTFFSSYVVEDAYRFLEQTSDPNVRQWVFEQNEHTEEKLKDYRKETKSTFAIEKYGDVSYKLPQKFGDYFFNTYYTGSNNAAVLFYRRSLNHDPIKLFDPNVGRKKDILDIESLSVSSDSRYVAIALSRNGTDWRELRIVDIRKRTVYKDHLKGLKFSRILWYENGFYYTTYEQESKFALNEHPKVMYHTLGEQQEDDELIIERSKSPNSVFDYDLSSDQRFLLLEIEDEITGVSSFFYRDHQKFTVSFKPLFLKLKESLSILDSYGDYLLALTYHNAPNGLIIKFKPENPYQWEQLIPEISDAVIEQVKVFEKEIVVEYYQKGNSILAIYDYEGNMVNSIILPEATSLGSISGNYADREFFFYFKSFTIPPIPYRFDLDKRAYELVEKTTVSFEFDNITYQQHEFPITDSLTATLTLVHDENLKMDGENPAIIKVYGGYGSIISPSFDPGIVWFIKNGGVYAIAAIRGGSEKGIDWWREARKNKKETSVHDLIKAAEFMVEEGYTKPGKVGIIGGSHGGMIVARAGLERPDLFGAVVPKAAPLDMIRFENYTTGQANVIEFGTVRDSALFLNLLDLSPYHSIQKDVNYPPMLVITGENDDRVPPFHSYKFVAQLQNRPAQTHPVLLKVLPQSGHYGQIGWKNMVMNTADVFSFFYHHLQLETGD
jgi:prolyl oligopeptidase